MAVPNHDVLNRLAYQTRQIRVGEDAGNMVSRVTAYGNQETNRVIDIDTALEPLVVPEVEVEEEVEAPADDVKADEPKGDEPTGEDVKTEEPAADEAKADDVKTEEPAETKSEAPVEPVKEEAPKAAPAKKAAAPAAKRPASGAK